MMRRVTVGLWIGLGSSFLWAAFEEKSFSARSSALGESLVGARNGVDSPWINPGALVWLDRAGVTLGHTSWHNEEDLPLNVLAVAVPAQRLGCFGGYWVDFGSRLYREREVALAWATRVGGRGGAGVALKRQDVRVERYGTLGAFQMDVGGRVLLAPRLGAGVSLKNLTQSRLGSTVESPPALYSAGLSFDALARGPLTAAVVQESGGRASWRVGQEVWIHDFFGLRAGFETDPNRFSLGLSFRRRSLCLDYAYATDPLLPDQHQFNLSYFP